MRSVEQADLAAAVHKMLAASSDPWRGLAEMGLMSVAVEGTLADLALVCEELGHHAVRGPVAESLAVAPALLGPRSEITTLAMPPHVPYAADAQTAALVLLVTDGNVYQAALGERHTSIDPARTLHEARAAGLLRSGVPPEAFESGVLANAAYLLGAGRALLEMSVRHGCVRQQFGRPVGANQAVQHRLADVAIGLEFAGPLLEAAASSLGTAIGPRDTSAALVACAAAAYGAARAALQVHGAIGYTTEHEMSGYLLRVRALLDAWGTRSWHRKRMMGWL